MAKIWGAATRRRGTEVVLRYPRDQLTTPILHTSPCAFALRRELRTLFSIVICVHLLTISPYLRYELQLCIMPARSQTLRHTPLPTFDDVVSSC
jgi:hypothetical protein